MKYYLQVLSPALPDCTPSLLLHFDSQRYLFNCGQGTQRFCNEHKLKLGKLKSVFVSGSVNWDRVGGVPGMLLTLADANVPQVHLYGPHNLLHFMASTRHFVMRQSLGVDVHEWGTQDVYSDENITLKPIHVFASQSNVSSTQSSKNDRKRKAHDIEGDTGCCASQHVNRSNLRHITLSQESSPQHKRQILSHMFGTPSESISEKLSIDPVEAHLNLPSQQQQEEQDKHFSASSTSNPMHVDFTLCYSIQGPRHPGKFNKEKAKALGIRPGPLYRDLQTGNNITISQPDGTEKTVTPDMVMEGAREGKIMLIMDIQKPDYISALHDHTGFTSLYESGEQSHLVTVIAHIIGKGCFTKEYMAWMKKFNPEVQHIILSEEFGQKRIIFKSHALSVMKAMQLDNEMFVLPWEGKESMELTTGTDLPPKTITGAPMLIYQLEPKSEVQLNEVPPDDWQRVSADVMATGKEVQTRLASSKLEQERLLEEQHMQQMLMDIHSSEGEGDQPVQSSNEHENAQSRTKLTVVPLGTGSAIPTKSRNVSSTLLQAGNTNIFLDAGEGTIGQLKRCFGPQGALQVLQNTKLLFISHLHADHHLGSVGLIKEWAQANINDDNLFIIAPRRFFTFLREYAEVEDFGISRCVFIDCGSSYRVVGDNVDTGAKMLFDSAGIVVKCIGVDHCPSAFACVIRAPTWSFAYSGDCRPSQQFAAEANEVDAMLHEATFNDDLPNEAISKKHCTISEALQVGRLAKAKHLILTHFSQRYPKIPRLSDVQDGRGPNDEAVRQQVIVAFDMARLELDNSWRWRAIMDGLGKVFESEDVEESD